MPVDFLSRVQEEKYGNFTEEPSIEQLVKYFWFDDQDKKFMDTGIFLNSCFILG